MKKYEKYKDSGIQWIGEIPEHWEIKKLSQQFKFTTGFTPSTGNNEFYENGVYDWVTIADLKNKYISKSSVKITQLAVEGKTIIPKGSLLYSFKLSVGKMAFTAKDLYTNEAIFSIFPQKNINLNYYYYLLGRTLIHNSNENIYGAKILNQELIKSAKLVIPSPFEQKQIGEYLDQRTVEIDSLISRKKRLISLLKEERSAIINKAVTKGTDPNVKYKESGIEWIGQIPEHWEVKKLKYLTYLKSGENIISEQIKEIEEYPVYGGNGLRGFYKSFTHEGNYVLIGRQGALCGNINYASGRFWASEHAIVCYLDQGNNWRWLGELLTTMNLNQYSQSAAQPGLAVEKIKNLLIPYPNFEEQTKIATHIEATTKEIDTVISKTEKEIALIKEYKSALINDVVTGKIDVRDSVVHNQDKLQEALQ